LVKPAEDKLKKYDLEKYIKINQNTGVTSTNPSIKVAGKLSTVSVRYEEESQKLIVTFSYSEDLIEQRLFVGFDLSSFVKDS